MIGSIDGVVWNKINTYCQQCKNFFISEVPVFPNLITPGPAWYCFDCVPIGTVKIVDMYGYPPLPLVDFLVAGSGSPLKGCPKDIFLYHHPNAAEQWEVEYQRRLKLKILKGDWRV